MSQNLWTPLWLTLEEGKDNALSVSPQMILLIVVGFCAKISAKVTTTKTTAKAITATVNNRS